MVTLRPKLNEKLKFFRKEKRVFATIDEKHYFEINEAVMGIMGLVNGNRTVSQIARDLAGDRQKARDVEETIKPALDKMASIGIVKFI